MPVGESGRLVDILDILIKPKCSINQVKEEDFSALGSCLKEWNNLEKLNLKLE